MREGDGLCAVRQLYARSGQVIRGETTLYALRTSFPRSRPLPLKPSTCYATFSKTPLNYDAIRLTESLLY